jgi:hypothetical protein
MSAIVSSISFPNVNVERPAINPWIIALTATLANFMELLTRLSPTSPSPYCWQPCR